VLALGSTEARAQDMQTFLRNLNNQTAIAQGHYRAGLDIYNRVPVQQRLDYKCYMGDMLACWVWQKQIENANRYMARHYRNLGR
jgi:hypothetical protein